MKPPVGHRAVELFYGAVTYRELSGGNVALTNSFVQDNIVTLHNVAGTGCALQLHHKIVPLFLECFKEAVVQCSNYRVRMLGGFCPRHVRNDASLPLSTHAYGAAFDINWDTNQMTSRKMGLVTDLPNRFIQAFTTKGWIWGGDWKGDTLDAMHFQWADGA